MPTARVGILGLTFKENVPDLRNSRVFDIITELASFGIDPLLHDPLADPNELQEEYGLRPALLEEFCNLNGLVFAVPHNSYRHLLPQGLSRMLAPRSVFVDVKSVLEPSDMPPGCRYWSL